MTNFKIPKSDVDFIGPLWALGFIDVIYGLCLLVLV